MDSLRNTPEEETLNLAKLFNSLQTSTSAKWTKHLSEAKSFFLHWCLQFRGDTE